jgi:hypothetical protein
VARDQVDHLTIEEVDEGHGFRATDAKLDHCDQFGKWCHVPVARRDEYDRHRLRRPILRPDVYQSDGATGGPLGGEKGRTRDRARLAKVADELLARICASALLVFGLALTRWVSVPRQHG